MAEHAQERPHRDLFVGQVPLPFVVDYDPRRDGSHHILDADGFTVCFMAMGRGGNEDDDLPKKIVRACNSHDRLLAACKELVATFDAHDVHVHSCDRDGNTYCDCLNLSVSKMRELIAAEEGKP